MAAGAVQRAAGSATTRPAQSDRSPGCGTFLDGTRIARCSQAVRGEAAHGIILMVESHEEGTQGLLVGDLAQCRQRLLPSSGFPTCVGLVEGRNQRLHPFAGP